MKLHHPTTASAYLDQCGSSDATANRVHRWRQVQPGKDVSDFRTDETNRRPTNIARSAWLPFSRALPQSLNFAPFADVKDVAAYYTRASETQVAKLLETATPKYTANVREARRSSTNLRAICSEYAARTASVEFVSKHPSGLLNEFALQNNGQNRKGETMLKVRCAVPCVCRKRTYAWNLMKFQSAGGIHPPLKFSYRCDATQAN